MLECDRLDDIKKQFIKILLEHLDLFDFEERNNIQIYDISEHHKPNLKFLLSNASKFSRYVCLVEERCGVTFSPILLVESYSEEELTDLNVVGYIGPEPLVLLNSQGEFHDNHRLSIEEREELIERWIEYEDQRSYFPCLTLTVLKVTSLILTYFL